MVRDWLDGEPVAVDAKFKLLNLERAERADDDILSIPAICLLYKTFWVSRKTNGDLIPQDATYRIIPWEQA